MIKHGRYFFPDSDTHFPERINENGFYQEDTFEAALKYCKATHCFMDIGAHIGLWTVKAIDSGFDRVIAFEPVLEHGECFKANTFPLNARIDLYDVILGNGGYGRMYNFLDGNTGALKVEFSDKPDNGFRPIHKLDDLLPEAPPQIDLLKIDVEGFEKQVLEGAKETILRCRPVIVVEQKSNREAIAYLQSLGAILQANVRRDYIFTWKN